MRSESALASSCSCKTVTRPPMGTSFGAAGRWTARSTSRDQPTWEWTTAGVCSTSLERKQECRTPDVGLAVGEHAITVHWCEDPSAAGDRKLTFVYDPMAEVTVIIASEIRLELSGADEPKVLAVLERVTRRGLGSRTWQQCGRTRGSCNKPRLSEKLLRRFIRAPSELEALRLCQHMTL